MIRLPRFWPPRCWPWHRHDWREYDRVGDVAQDWCPCGKRRTRTR